MGDAVNDRRLHGFKEGMDKYLEEVYVGGY